MSRAEGHVQVQIRMSLGWREEIRRAAHARALTVNKLLLGIIGEALGLGSLPTRKVMTVTEKIAKSWVLPGSEQHAALKRARRAAGAAGASERAELEQDPSPSREDGAGQAGRGGSGRFSADGADGEGEG